MISGISLVSSNRSPLNAFSSVTVLGCPVAIFNPVIIDGTTITRASLHNITVMTELLGKPYVGQHIWVKKSNMIIPKVTRAIKIDDLKE